ncbi:MAG: hypothetical protein Ct9H300mP27_01040 [Chloroflexota bacterium]|nr:MAG: hypothetical protein Ct9H300mP27_01040 [Chloroflexota bacterium]
MFKLWWSSAPPRSNRRNENGEGRPGRNPALPKRPKKRRGPRSYCQDYLARRDPVWMGPIYEALGLSGGCLQHDQAYLYDPHTKDPTGSKRPSGHIEFLRPVTRSEAYAADVLYGTNNEFGFDYLRDNMSVEVSEKVQRQFNYAIVDEVDNILIDEARTPLIISGPAEEPVQHYYTFAKLAPRLQAELDYSIDERSKPFQ